MSSVLLARHRPIARLSRGSPCARRRTIARDSLLAAATALLLAAPGCRTITGAQPAAGQRPTFTTSSATTAAGTWEIETGLLVDPEDLIDTPTTLKYGYDERTELFTRLSPLLHVSSGDHTGLGDLVIGARRRFVDATDEHPSFGLQAAVKLPTASRDAGLGTGNADVILSAMGSKAVGATTLCAYYEAEILGDDNGGSDVAMGHAASLLAGWTLDDAWSAFAELGARTVPEQDYSTEFVTLGLYYTIDPTWVVDFAMISSIGGDELGPQFAVGFTRNLGTR